MKTVLEKHYIYTREHTEAALRIADRTFLKKRKLVSLILPLLILAAGVGLLCDGNIKAAIVFAALAVIDALLTLFGKSDRNRFEAEVSLDGGQKYWPAQRTFELRTDRVIMHAPYSNPDEYLTEKMKSDAEYMKYREEMIEGCSHMEIMLDKCRCYESDEAFLIRSRYMELPLLVSDFSEEEAQLVRSTLRSAIGKRYTTIL